MGKANIADEGHHDIVQGPIVLPRLQGRNHPDLVVAVRDHLQEPYPQKMEKAGSYSAKRTLAIINHPAATGQTGVHTEARTPPDDKRTQLG